MSESSWNLTGVDRAARDRAVKEAARRGVSLADYLTNIVLQNALADEVRTQGYLGEATPLTDIALQSPLSEPAPNQSVGFPDPAETTPTPGQSFAIRHQIKTLERHFGSSV